MRICLLTTQELDAVPYPDDDWPCDPRPFLPDAEWHLEVMEKETAGPRIIELSRMGFDLFFNLCDGAYDETTPGIEVVEMLERLEVPFTGAASRSYEPSRVAMKRVCHALGIDTPAYVMASCDADIEHAAATLMFPLIVKHPNSYASIDLTAESRVTNPADLAVQARGMIDKYSATLIEEFIEGDECTVLVAENHDDPDRPIAYQPIQYRFPEGETFKHEDVKWVDYANMSADPVADAELDAKLRHVSAEFFRGMRGTSFARMDIRIDAEGRPFILEINSNCGVYHEPDDAGSADFCLLNDPAGHVGFTRQLVDAALARHTRESRPWHVRLGDSRAFGMFATRRLTEGEPVVRFEETPHTLVSLSRVEAEWPEADRARFDREAWPITDEVWVMWEGDAEEWRMPRHSCDPSVWFEGLDLVARRQIESGEEITVDYATFRNERMPAFECDCGSSDCRGIVSGEDLDGVAVAKYGEHISDYVRNRRNALVGGVA